MFNVIFDISGEKYNTSFGNIFSSYGVYMDAYEIGELLISFYNINLNEFANIISFPVDCSKEFDEAISAYIYESFIKLKNVYNPIISTLILNEIEDCLCSLSLEQSYKINLETYQIFKNYAALQLCIDHFINGEWEKLNTFLLQIQSINAKYTLNNSGQIVLSLFIKDIYSLIALEMAQIQGRNKLVKRCENCNKLFIPSKRSDEIYCDRIIKNGKTCKDIGYAEKEKKDPIKSLYTNARKTQHARIRYRSHIPDYKEKHFEPWKKAAEEARDRFQKTNDVEGFKKWLEDNKDAF